MKIRKRELIWGMIAGGLAYIYFQRQKKIQQTEAGQMDAALFPTLPTAGGGSTLFTPFASDANSTPQKTYL